MNHDLKERMRHHVLIRGGARLENSAWSMILEAADRIEQLEADLEKALAALAAGEEAGGVRVRALEWTAQRRSGLDIHVGTGLGLRYEVASKLHSPDWIVMFGRFEVIFDGACADENEAKAAAQADYERRVLSALEPTPSPIVDDAMVERMADWLSVEFMGQTFHKGTSREFVEQEARAALNAALSGAREGGE